MEQRWIPVAEGLPEPYRESEDMERNCEHYAPMTNADRIRSMTDGELAIFLCKVKADYQWVDHEYPNEDACGDWEEWLRAESEEKHGK